MKNQLSNSPMKFMIRLSALALVAIALLGCDEDNQQQSDLNQERREVTELNRQTEPETSPVPVEPVGGRGGLYGTGPGGSFYGNQ
jgi:hypothetical protein